MQATAQQDQGIGGAVVAQRYGPFGKPDAGVVGIEALGFLQGLESLFRTVAAQFGFRQQHPTDRFVGEQPHGEIGQTSSVFGLAETQ